MAADDTVVAPPKSAAPKKARKSSSELDDEANLPFMKEEEMKNMIRVCRRLMGGANLPNLKKMW